MRWFLLCSMTVGLLADLAGAAPLVRGLDGPTDFGAPVARDPATRLIDLSTLAPGGLRFYRGLRWQEIYINWPSSISFGQQLCCFDGRVTIPAPELPEFGRLPPRIVGNLARVGGFDAELEQYVYLGYDDTRIIATWHEIPHVPPEFDPEAFNSFQIIITPVGNAGDFDLEMRFERCEFTRDRDRPDFEHGAMGLDGGRGAEGPGWMWQGSLTEDMLLLCELSNVGDPAVREPGLYRFEVRDGEPRGCQLGNADLDQPGMCQADDHLPGDGCSPDCFIEGDIDGDGRYEAPYPGALDPLGSYDDCTDVDNPACDDDDDDDGVPNQIDNCDAVPNPDQHDYDGDSFGDVCDIDADADGMVFPHDPETMPGEYPDACPLLTNFGTRRVDPDPLRILPIQVSDPDRDGLGDECDDDDDGDGVIDCGTDGICDPRDNGADDDLDGRTDEDTECVPGDERFDRCERGDRDLQDNDGDGYIDDFDERDLPAIVWPGPDPDDSEDNCRKVPNPGQYDQDGDGVGDACDLDIDGDGVDNCAGGLCGPAFDGRDNDRDGQIDEPGECVSGCDPAADLADQDRDGYVDEDFELLDEIEPFPPKLDNCPLLPNPDQADRNADGVGDLCGDDDQDGWQGIDDNCIDVANPDQADLDGDGVGDICDSDDDGDGAPDTTDVCPRLADDQSDLDADGEGDACDADDDADGINDPFDLCPRNHDPEQPDLDADGEGDACDPDDDGDGVDDDADVCPREPDDQTDTDGDGIGDICDDDDDGDGTPDDTDRCRLIPDDQADIDGDGLGDACDPTDDRPFELRTPEEQCAILLAEDGPTAHRLAVCPARVVDTCAASPGTHGPHAWWLLGLLALRRRSR